MCRLLPFCNLLQNTILEKKLFLTIPTFKLLNLFLHFLHREGFLLRIIDLRKNFSKIFLKYNNGFSTMNQLNFYVKKNQKIFLTRVQLEFLIKQNPNIYFIFYNNGCFLNKVQALDRKCGGLLVCVVI